LTEESDGPILFCMTIGRPRLEKGPKGKPSPILALRLGRSELARLKRRARKEKRSVSQLAREILSAEERPRFPLTV
jgi:hypothetical protein